jgi:hypothetical protein
MNVEDRIAQRYATVPEWHMVLIVGGRIARKRARHGARGREAVLVLERSTAYRDRGLRGGHSAWVVGGGNTTVATRGPAEDC